MQDVIFSVGARNASRVLSLMSALPVNAGPARRQLINVGAGALTEAARDHALRTRRGEALRYFG